ncbi:13589_t:CDS:2, partial [Acaulospora colombiana]
MIEGNSKCRPLVPSIGTVQVTLLDPDLVSKFTKNANRLQKANTTSFTLDNVDDDARDGLRDVFSFGFPVWTSGHVHGPLGWTWPSQ